MQCKTTISIKDYFPKLKKIPYEQYNLIISNNKEEQIIPLKNPENKLYQLSSKLTQKDLTYLITLINSGNRMVIGKANLTIASFRLKQLKEIKKIKYEQQIKIGLNKIMKEKLFGPGINIGNIYIKLIIDISVCFIINNICNNIFIYKLENSNNTNNLNSNNGNDYNLSNLSLSSFLTNRSTLKENKKQNEKKIKNIPSFNNIKYLYTEISSKQNKNNHNKEENNAKRKAKILSPNKYINLKKYRTKWHINKEYLKNNNFEKNKTVKDKNISTTLSNPNINKIKNDNNKADKIRKVFSTENIRNKNNNIRLNTEICNNDTKNISNSKFKKDVNKNKTEEMKQKNGKKIGKHIKKIKSCDNLELKNNIISLINNIEEKNKEIKNKFDVNNSKYLLIKEKITNQHKMNGLIQDEFEENNIKNFIHVNINKQANNILLKQMPKIKQSELNIFKIIFNQKINNKNKADPKLIIKEKIKQQKQIQVLIDLIRNLVKIYGNVSHLYENDDNKKILIKSLFLRYNIKEKEWNENDDLFDTYEKILKEKNELEYQNRYLKEKEDFNTIKEEEDEDLNTIE